MADLVTVRIPELPAYNVFGDLTVNDRLPVWMAGTNKTVYAPISYLRSFFQSGGGISHTPVVSGNSMIVEVSSFEAGSKLFSIPSIAGKDFVLRRAAVGALRPGPDYEILDAGGFKLIQTDDQLWFGEKFELEFYSFIPTTTSPTAPASSLFKGVLQVSANKTLGPSDMGNLVQIRANDTAIALTLPELSTIPANTPIMIEAMINNTRKHIVNTQSDQKIYFENASHIDMYIAPGESLWLFKGEDGYYMIPSYGNFSCVGDVSYGYRLGLNELALDGSIVLRSDEPRLWAWAQTIGGSLVTEADWQSSIDFRGCFSTGDGSTTFRLPDHRNTTMRGLKTLIGSDADRPFNQEGGYQADEFELHDHDLKYFKNDANGGSQGNMYYLGSDNGGIPLGATDYQTAKRGGSETRMKNIGMMPKIKC